MRLKIWTPNGINILCLILMLTAAMLIAFDLNGYLIFILGAMLALEWKSRKLNP